MKIHNPNEPFDDELVSAYLDDELPPEERAKVEQRLAFDPAARRLLEELQAVSQAVRQMPPESLGEDLRASILRRAERAKLVKSNSAASVQTLREMDAPQKRSKWTIGRTRRGWVWAGMAVAAALLIMVVRPDEPDQSAGPELIAARSERLEETPSAGFEFRGEGSGGAIVAARPEGDLARRSYGELLDRSSATAEHPNPMLVVYVCARPEAIRSRTIDEVLLSNQIYLENEPAVNAEGAIVSAKQMEAKEIEATRDLARAYRVPQQQSAAAAERLTEQLGGNLQRNEAETVGDELAAHPEEAPTSLAAARELAPGDVDVVLVEAPLSQVAGCLSGIQADRYNYKCVEVQEPTEVDKKPVADSAVNWQQYNRGRAMEETWGADSYGALRDDTSEQQPASAGTLVDSASRFGGTGGASQQPSIGRSTAVPPADDQRQMASNRDAQFAQTKESLDEVLQQSLPVVASRKLKLAKNAVQVLFVLSADPPTSGEAASGEPVQPSAPSSPAATESDD